MDEILESIANSLKRIQTEVGSYNFVIFTIPTKEHYYIQFSGEMEEPKLYAEAVSNNYLEPEFLLSKKQIIQLQSMGWHPPSSDGNFYQEWQAKNDEDRMSIAQAVVQTFTTVYGLTPNQLLDVELVLDEVNAEYLEDVTMSRTEVVEDFTELILEDGRRSGHLIFEEDDLKKTIPVYWKVKFGEIGDGNSWKVSLSFSQNWHRPNKTTIDLIFHYLRSLTTVLKLQINDGTVAQCGIVMEEYESMEDFFTWGAIIVVSPDLGRAYIENQTLWGNILLKENEETVK